MMQRTIILAAVAALAVTSAADARPAHHRAKHGMSHGKSKASPAEMSATQDLNRKSLEQASAAPGGMASGGAPMGASSGMAPAGGAPMAPGADGGAPMAPAGDMPPPPPPQ